MCDTCGCNVTHGNEKLIRPGGKLHKTESGREAVSVLHNLLSENDHTAQHNRQHFDQHGVLAVNLMSSPGAGKTALLEATIRMLGEAPEKGWRIAVIEGDLETENDAERIRRHGVEAIQIATGSACHLDAHMIHQALHNLDLTEYDIVFIENVGNLVCPAGFDLGEAHKVVIASVTEGEDKPLKYPNMFAAASLMLVSKVDLLPHLDFDVEQLITNARRVNPGIAVIQVSATGGEGMERWLQWLAAARAMAAASA